MIQKLKGLIIALSYAAALLFPLAAPAYAAPTCNPTGPEDQSCINSNLCQGSNLSFETNGNGCDTNVTGSGSKVTDFIKKVINILSVIIGAIAVLMIIIGGFRYVTSAGNAEATKSARQTIIFALIGLIIVALAQVIVHFVLNSVVTS